MMRIRLVIWDWNGTLLNDAPAGHTLMNALLLKRRKPGLTFDAYRRIYQHPIQNMYQAAGFDVSNEPFEDVALEWYHAYQRVLPQLKLHTNALEALHCFRKYGIQQAILSACPTDLLESCITDLGIRDYFTLISGLTDSYAKSKLTEGHTLIQKLKAVPSETILIGDSTHDHEVAKALGVKTLLVSHGFEHPERLARLGQPVFDSFANLLCHIGFSARNHSVTPP